jgi:GNAT superfamily N-acetyltransferase
VSLANITPARTVNELAIARRLFVEYAGAIGVDLEYQGFSAELATLPGKYAPPSGELLIAMVDGTPAGCVALRALDPAKVEIKRLYVRDSARGSGLGKRLVESAISAARRVGYTELRLDTLETMTAARTLYQSLGFLEIPPYGDAHIPGTRFYALALT